MDDVIGRLLVHIGDPGEEVKDMARTAKCCWRLSILVGLGVFLGSWASAGSAQDLSGLRQRLTEAGVAMFSSPKPMPDFSYQEARTGQQLGLRINENLCVGHGHFAAPELMGNADDASA